MRQISKRVLVITDEAAFRSLIENADNRDEFEALVKIVMAARMLSESSLAVTEQAGAYISYEKDRLDTDLGREVGKVASFMDEDIR